MILIIIKAKKAIIIDDLICNLVVGFIFYWEISSRWKVNWLGFYTFSSFYFMGFVFLASLTLVIPSPIFLNSCS